MLLRKHSGFFNRTSIIYFGEIIQFKSHGLNEIIRKCHNNTSPFSTTNNEFNYEVTKNKSINRNSFSSKDDSYSVKTVEINFLNNTKIIFDICGLENKKKFGRNSIKQYFELLSRNSKTDKIYDFAYTGIGVIDYSNIMKTFNRADLVHADNIENINDVIKRVNGSYIPAIQKCILNRINVAPLGRERLLELASLGKSLLFQPKEIFFIYLYLLFHKYLNLSDDPHNNKAYLKLYTPKLYKTMILENSSYLVNSIVHHLIYSFNSPLFNGTNWKNHFAINHENQIRNDLKKGVTYEETNYNNDNSNALSFMIQHPLEYSNFLKNINKEIETSKSIVRTFSLKSSQKFYKDLTTASKSIDLKPIKKLYNFKVDSIPKKESTDVETVDNIILSRIKLSLKHIDSNNDMKKVKILVICDAICFDETCELLEKKLKYIFEADNHDVLQEFEIIKNSDSINHDEKYIKENDLSKDTCGQIHEMQNENIKEKCLNQNDRLPCDEIRIYRRLIGTIDDLIRLKKLSAPYKFSLLVWIYLIAPVVWFFKLLFKLVSYIWSENITKKKMVTVELGEDYYDNDYNNVNENRNTESNGTNYLERVKKLVVSWYRNRNRD